MGTPPENPDGYSLDASGSNSEISQSPIDEPATRSPRHGFAIAAVILLAFILRTWAAWQLPVDFDEPVYLEGAYDYAELIRAGDWQGLIDYAKVSEHPPLTRLLYAGAILWSENGLAWEQALLISRMVSVLLGTLGVVVLTILDPLAGLLFALQTLAVKYTSQAYLEATALFAALLTVFSLLRSRKLGDGWFWLSAVALGLTAAAKYAYFPIFFVVVYVVWWVKRYRSPLLGAFLGLSLASFLIFDPHLWKEPVSRLLDSLLYHQQYALGAHVQEVGYAWYQPFTWISRSHGYIWHPEVFFYMGIDGVIFLLSLYGAYVDWHKRRWVVVWLVVTMTFLLAWPTKWPQYTLVLIPAICLAAASAIRDIYARLQEQEAYWDWFSNMFPRPSRRYMTCGGIVLGLFLLIIAVNTAILTYNRLSWSSMTAENSGLPGNAVNDLLVLQDGRMLVASDTGAAIWQAAGEEDLQDQWQMFSTQNSGLPSNRVLSLAQTEDGVLWFGTLAGLARYDNQQWQVYNATDLGLGSGQVNDLLVVNGGLWVATQQGAAFFDGSVWSAFDDQNSGLPDLAVFALAWQPMEQGGLVWFGTQRGLASYNPTRGTWSHLSEVQVGVDWGGVANLLVDSQGRLWVSTLGGGIAVLDDQRWSYLRASNSDLPYNIVTDVEENGPGVFWIASSVPNTTGGVVSRLEGDEWMTYKPIFSGYTGAETLAIARDSLGRMWFATRTRGIYIFEEQK